MDAIWWLFGAPVLGMPYAYYFFYARTTLDVVANLYRIYYVRDAGMFDAVYDKAYNYEFYCYWHNPRITKMQFLRVFQEFDSRTAYTAYRKRILAGFWDFTYVLVKHLFILTVLGWIVSPNPFFFVPGVGFCFLLILAYRPWIQRDVHQLIIVRDFVTFACTQVHGEKKAGWMMRRRDEVLPLSE